MEITEITATYSEKKQLKSYEPVQMNSSITATLEDGDDPEEVYEKLAKQVKANVGRELARRVREFEMENEVER